MTNFGLGVMISKLAGNDNRKTILNAAGKEISMIAISGNSLEVRFSDGAGIEFYDNGQSCCEQRYMNTDDDLGFFVGSILEKAEITDGPTEEKDGDPKDCEFLIITTSKGQFTVANYNEHNGYYGGFDIIVRQL